jgi:hypothetical protein
MKRAIPWAYTGAGMRQRVDEIVGWDPVWVQRGRLSALRPAALAACT